MILYNKSFEVGSYSELMEYAHSGQQVFKRYQREAMLGTLVDHQAWLEETDAVNSARDQLTIFQAWLRSRLLYCWDQLEKTSDIINHLGCRDNLPSPAPRADARYDQDLRLDACGNSSQCKLKGYLLRNRGDFELLHKTLLLQDVQDVETGRRTTALLCLLAWIGGAVFKRQDCHACGDVLICHEAPKADIVVSKNRKHFEPLCAVLGKEFMYYISGGHR
jgi:hypothetical protein